jgi:integrase
MALMSNSINRTALVPAHVNKDMKHRLMHFVDWLDQAGGRWTDPDFSAYSAYLLGSGLSPESASAYTATVLGRYTTIIHDWHLLCALFPEQSHLKETVDQLDERFRSTFRHMRSAQISNPRRRAPAKHLVLTEEQATVLIAAPGVNNILGLRNTAVLAVLLCTGLRQAELCALDVPDVFQELDGQPALHVPSGSGCRERRVPYGDLIWVRRIIEAWLRAANISDGPVFRGLYRGSAVRSTRISGRTVVDILGRYPIMIDGEFKAVAASDLRRTYARYLHESGLGLATIQSYLGLATINDTRRLVSSSTFRGSPTSEHRDLAKLEDVVKPNM